MAERQVLAGRTRDGVSITPARSLAEADIVVTPGLLRARYIPQIAAEMFHDRHGEWPGRCKWAVGQKNPRARNMFAHNHWQNIAAAQRRDDPGFTGRASYHETMDRSETAGVARSRAFLERVRNLGGSLGS